MENATQALLIAGGVLLAMVIVSIGVTMFITHDKTAGAITEKWNTVELNKYNSSFTVFEGRSDITSQEIATLVSLAKEREGNIAIYVRTKTGTKIGNNNLTEYDKKQITQFLNEHVLTTSRDSSGNLVQKNNFSYVENSIKYDDLGRITEIGFIENN